MPCLTLISFSTAYAASVTNDIQSIGPQSGVKPQTFLCFQNNNGEVTMALAPHQRGDANQASGNPYYAGATIRFGGCTLNNDYLGYIGFNISSQSKPTITAYTPPQDVHIACQNPQINAQGIITGTIAYTPIQPNFSMQAPSFTSSWLFTGVNLSGLEFGKSISPSVIPNLSQEDSDSLNSDLKDTQTFINAGMNTIRVPVSWDYLQWDGPNQQGINTAYYENYVKPLLETLTSAKIYTIVDLHSYMRYSTYGKQYSGCGDDGVCPDGALILDVNAYRSVWGQLWQLIQQNPDINSQYLMFDLVNEPVDVPGDKVFSIQANLINMLRENQFDGYILVEGNAWSGLHSWATATWSEAGKTYSNATLFTRENFEKAGITDLSKILINVHQYLDSDFSGTHQDCQQNITTTGPSGFNLDSFVSYLEKNQLHAIVTELGVGNNSQSCTAPLTQFMAYLQKHAATSQKFGFVGWTMWSSGHAWGNYNLRVKPNDYRMKIITPLLKSN